MALISMAVFDTVENKRTEYTEKTLECLSNTVDWNKHILIISDNGSCKATHDLYEEFHTDFPFVQINNGENIGTAEAVNRAWKFRIKGQHAIKMDNDVIINEDGWVDKMEDAIEREPRLGIVGLKRKDLWENPYHTSPWYKSELVMLPHEPGQSWIIVERANHIMGTCQMYSSALLDKIGYLFQPKLYGFDDSLASARSNLAGFVNVFLPSIEIEHIDRGDTDFQKWKEKHAGEYMDEYGKILDAYKKGTRNIYYNPFEDESKTNSNSN